MIKGGLNIVNGKADQGMLVGFGYLVEAEFAFYVAPFAGADEFLVGEADRVEWAFNFFPPEVDEFVEFGKVWCDVVELQAEGVQY